MVDCARDEGGDLVGFFCTGEDVREGRGEGGSCLDCCEVDFAGLLKERVDKKIQRRAKVTDEVVKQFMASDRHIDYMFR